MRKHASIQLATRGLYFQSLVVALISAICLPAAFAISAGLAWNASQATKETQRGETNAVFSFSVTNLASAPVTITAVRPSCGCTVPKLPQLPWTLVSGTNGLIEINMDVRGRTGTVTKTITVESTSGTNILTVSAKLPELDARELNRLRAFADRQAVFKQDCASCHLEPAIGKQGKALYDTICGICHEAEHRADMVPDLAKITTVRNAAYWGQWIRMGKPGSFMPAFAKPYGGPLTDLEILSLINYLTEKYPGQSPALPPAP